MSDKLEHGQYKGIPGYPNYEINHRGDVRRLWKSSKPTPLIPTLKKGIYVVRLTGPDGSRKEERIHKLMQRTFLSPPAQGQVVYHKNGNRLDNWINNLGYISRKELGKKTGGGSRKAVMKLSCEKEVVEIYRSARCAARENFMSYQTIIDRCNGKVKSELAPDGFIYRWDDEEAERRGRPRKEAAVI
ncbi:hypothetical protein [Paenibacillus sp. 8b26]|uniref:hypothetical protein n=1 Tax=Paenibacillus sp. 8b26 TaxID=3424133 RepID=UPI003D65E89A